MVNTLKLKGRIRELNLTQDDCAKTLGVKTPTLNQKLNNLRPFSLSQAENLASLLKIADYEFGYYFFCQQCCATLQNKSCLFTGAERGQSHA